MTSKVHAHAGLVVLALGLLGACDDGKKDIGQGIPVVGHDASGFGDGGFLPDGPTPMGAGGVEIEVLAPARMTILVVGSAPEVRARVRSVARSGMLTTDPILPESVRFFVSTEDPKGPMVSGPLTGPNLMSEYSGRADLTGLPTGRYFLAVTASTRGGGRGAAQIEVLVDAGPRITILSPREQGSYKGSVAVEFVVEAMPFELEGMPEAFVGSRAVTVQPGDGPGRYRGIIEFSKFEPPLADDQLFRVVARNKQGTTAQARSVFFVDDDGPLITETQPKEGLVVGGVVHVSAKLTDRAGVLGPSVVAFIGNRGGEGFELELLPEAPGSSVYSALFDTRKLNNCRQPNGGFCNVWPNLSFRASDLLGNERVVAYDIAIDNTRPDADLDPPSVRIIREVDGACSRMFDPVGSFDPVSRNRRLGDAPDDGCNVGQLFDLRAQVEDRGNDGTGGKLLPTSGIEPMSVVAFVMDDTSQALAVDMDGDGSCDGINPKLIPTTMPPQSSTEILAVRLTPLTPSGTPDYTEGRLENGCGPALPEFEKKPPRLCLGQENTVIVGYPAWNSPQAAIWAIDPVNVSWCQGGQFDTHANQIQDGWACIAVMATDKVGNTTVSQPLRVFIDKQASFGANICPARDPSTLPDCTGRFDRAMNAIVPGASCRGSAIGAGPR